MNDLSWLLTRAYAPNAALKLVGDRYCLTARQRLAVARCACADEEQTRRLQHCIATGLLKGKEIWLDGFNVITTVEAALSGGVILHARDECFRDMASMHGSYRRVAETIPAIEMIGAVLESLNLGPCRWFLDQPVSNSGRLKAVLGKIASERGWLWQIELCNNPDLILANGDQIVASADSQIINQAARWCNLARVVVQTRIPSAWIVDLSI